MKTRLFSGIILLTMLMAGLSLQGMQKDLSLDELLEKQKLEEEEKEEKESSSSEEKKKVEDVEEKAATEYQLDSVWFQAAPEVKGHSLTDAYWLRVPYPNINTYTYAVLIKMHNNKIGEYPTIEKKYETTWEPKNFDYIDSFGNKIPTEDLFLWGQTGWAGISAIANPISEKNLHELTYAPFEKGVNQDKENYFKIVDGTVKNVSEINFADYQKTKNPVLINPANNIANAITENAKPSPLYGSNAISLVNRLKPTMLTAGIGGLGGHYLTQYLTQEKNSGIQSPTSNNYINIGLGAFSTVLLMSAFKKARSYLATEKISVASCNMAFNTEGDVSIENRKKYFIAAFDTSGVFHDVDIICFQQWPILTSTTTKEEEEKNKIQKLSEELKREIESRGYLVKFNQPNNLSLAIAYKEKRFKFTENNNKNTIFFNCTLTPLNKEGKEDTPKINLINIDNTSKNIINALNTIKTNPDNKVLKIVCGNLGYNTYTKQYGAYKVGDSIENPKRTLDDLFLAPAWTDAATIGGYTALPTARMIEEKSEGNNESYFARNDYIYYRPGANLKNVTCLKYEYYPSNLMFLLKPRPEEGGLWANIKGGAKWLVENPAAQFFGINWLYRSLPGTDKSSISGRQKEYFSNHAVIKALFRIK